MTRIGYTVKSDSKEELSLLYDVGGCEEVVQLQENEENYDKFEQFLLDNKNNEIVLVSFPSMGLQLTQVAKLLDLIRWEELSIHFIEKQLESDQKYLALLYELAINEKEVVSRRTRRGLRAAQEKGIVSGRPTITKKKIEKIQYFRLTQKKTIREISAECGVSLGTVHKYINLLEQT